MSPINQKPSLISLCSRLICFVSLASAYSGRFLYPDTSIIPTYTNLDTIVVSWVSTYNNPHLTLFAVAVQNGTSVYNAGYATLFNRTVPSNGEQSVDLTFGTRPSVCLFMLHDEGETTDVSSGSFIVLNETSAPAKTWESDSPYGYVSIPKVTDSYRGRGGGGSSSYKNIAIAVPIVVCALLLIGSAAFFFVARRQRSRATGHQPNGYQPSPLLNVQDQNLNNRDVKLEPMYQRIYHETDGNAANHEIQGQPLGELPART